MLRKYLFTVTLLASSFSYATPDTSIVFDGSGSMCGYFTPQDNNRILLNLIQEAMIARGSSSSVAVFALRQKVKNKINSQIDLSPVEPNFQALAEVLDQQGRKNGCAPFDGLGSNIELIFDNQAAVKSSNLIVLVTDSQLQEADRDNFLRGYENWVNATIKEGKTPYTGYIVAQSSFEGGYYPIAEPDNKLKASGYQLVKHNRPILLFWFAKDEKKLNYVSNMVRHFASLKPIAQHILPFTYVDNTLNKFEKFSNSMSLSQLLFDAGKITAIQRYDTDRSESVIRTCFKSSIQGNELILQVKPTCADNKPFWEGVTSIKYEIKANQIAPNTKIDISDWVYNAKNNSFEKVINRSFKEEKFIFKPSLLTINNRANLENWSISSDFCPDINKKNKACIDRLNGKTYQLDILSQQLVNRSKPLSEQLLVPISSSNMLFKIVYKK